MSVVSRVRVTGPLERYARGFAAELEGLGYTPLSAANQVRLMAHLSRWLATESVDPGELNSEGLQAFLAARSGQGYTCWLSQRGLAPLVSYLRGRAVVPALTLPAPLGPVEELLAEYRTYLVGERGLVKSTVRGYEAEARLFLTRRTGGDLQDLTAGEVSRFMVAECGTRSTGSAKILVTALRSLLRWLLLTGRVDVDLAQVVPGVAGWRLSSLPRALGPDQVRALLACCDRGRSSGRRDYAILTVLVRLGLRAAEVAAMELDDVDWRAGEVIVRGKRNQRDRLPLPVDVGEALVAYLRQDRPGPGGCRRVFVRVRAPRGPLTPSGVQSVVKGACTRAGITPAGAHRLRHTAATAVLQAGASLEEVAQLLRHRDLTSTAIYAKVDQARLRTLARPWPVGGVS
ncbi:MAG: site-specific integrase [Mycobacterium sp.]